MIFLANIVYGLGYVLDMVLGIFLFLTIGRAIISWVSPDPMNPIVRFLISATEPLLSPIRKIVPPFGGNIDWSPIILLMLIYLARIVLAQSLMEYAFEMKKTAYLLISVFA